jgi:hypothetical protein
MLWATTLVIVKTRRICSTGMIVVALAGGLQPAMQAQQLGVGIGTKSADPHMTEDVTLPAGTPLHVRVTHTAHLHTGAAVVGVLTEPIYLRDRLVLPVNSVMHGIVTAYTPVDHLVREQALLNGDVTPLHDPVVAFTGVHLDAWDEDVALDSRATIRATQLVRFSSAKKPSLVHQAVTAAKARVHDAYQEVFGPGKKDRALKLLYGQLPYHPQRIWTGTQFIADLNASATVTLPAQPPVPQSDVASLNGVVVDARLDSSLDSKTAKKGDVVMALVTAPAFDQTHKLILPEGTEIDGLVSQSKPARSLGRNGQLRLRFAE